MDALQKFYIRQLKDLRLVWARFKDEAHAQTPTGWVEAKVLEAEKYWTAVREEVENELVGKIDHAIWEVLNGIEDWFTQEKAQLEADYGVTLDEAPSKEKLLEDCLAMVGF